MRSNTLTRVSNNPGAVHLALKETPSSGADIFLINRKVIDMIVPMREKIISLFSLILLRGSLYR